MKSLILFMAAWLLSSSFSLAQTWIGSSGNTLRPNTSSIRVGLGISNPTDFDSPSPTKYSNQVKLLSEATDSSGTIKNVGNIGHLLKGNFGGTSGIWSTLGGPGFPGILNEPIYGLKIQYNEYAVNLDMADRAIVDNGFGSTPTGTLDAVLFWDKGLSGSSDGHFVLGPTLSGGEILKIIEIDDSDAIDITTGFGATGGFAGADITLTTPNSSGFAGWIILDPGTGGSVADGIVRVNGDGEYTGSWTKVSDKKFKKDITPISSAANLIKKLRGVTYHYKVDEFSDLGFSNERQYGFIAQEVQEVVPELVTRINYKDSSSHLSLNITDMIPILVEAIKEQQSAMDSLRSEVSRLTEELQEDEQDEDDVESSSARLQSGALPVDGSAMAESLATQSELFQNTPNPFSNSTEIRFSVAEGAESASLYIYDMNGLQLKSIPINGRGESSLPISGGELKAGMYLYSLIVDGREVETKRMILTR